MHEYSAEYSPELNIQCTESQPRHHYLHDTTAFDAHVYGSGLEEYFCICLDVLPCCSASAPAQPHDAPQLVPQQGRPRTKAGASGPDDANFHATTRCTTRTSPGTGRCWTSTLGRPGPRAPAAGTTSAGSRPTRSSSASRTPRRPRPRGRPGGPVEPEPRGTGRAPLGRGAVYLTARGAAPARTASEAEAGGHSAHARRMMNAHRIAILA